MLEADLLRSPAPAITSELVRQRLTLLLASLLVANPVILFLLTRRVGLSCAVVVTVIVATQAMAFRRRWRLIAAYLFNSIAVLSLFAHAEVVLLHAFPEHVIDNLYSVENGYYFNLPFLDRTFVDKEYSVRYLTNAQGFRIAEEQEPAHTVSAVDWLVIGDSFTQGAQVNYSDLYTAKLEQHFPDKITLNAGVSGLGIGHEYNYFLHAGAQLHPRLVILQLCSFNDFMNVEPSLVGVTERLMTHSAFIRYILAPIKFTNPAQLPLGRWTEPFQARPSQNADYNIFYRHDSDVKRQDLLSFKKYLALLNAAVTQGGARLLVILIPTKEQVHERYLLEVQRAFSIASSDLDMHRPNDVLASFARELNIDVLDLLPSFRQAAVSPFLEYDEHLSVVGHTIIAEALAERLRRTEHSSLVTRLSTDLAGDRYAMFSADGSVVSYQSPRGGNMELFVAKTDFSGQRRLTTNDIDESHPMLSRDASQVIFTEGDTAGLQSKVAVMNVDGSDRRLVTSEPNQFGAIPSFSPDNKQIAYAEWYFDPTRAEYTKPRIAVVDVLSGSKRFATGPDRDAWRPVFFPDGKRLAYIATAPGGKAYDLYTYDLTASTEQQLTHSSFDEWDPQVSRDGGRIVYAARQDGNWDLFVHDCATGAVSRQTRTKGDEWDPVFTPDGQEILYAGRYGLVEAVFRMRFRK